ncbi:ribonuclease R [Chitinophaga jiangningensis]|uniref:Ribonuclease R n=1 Tax=Chitinophaga jiangningensis TaxID=1419482 RepID=A0A1M7MZ25_9BACT|nr:ribonuclease R [Chitinophaga jiangningensis]SHM96340.1 ribonuclease R [Chitinophaga jiangningensis]
MSKKKKNKKGGNHHHGAGGPKKTFKGIVEVTRSGMAFVIVQGLARDILVKQKNLNTALDGDEVLVDVLKPGNRDSRMEGVITDILKRNKTEFTGTLQVSKNFGFLIPEKGMFMPDIYIPANSIGAAKTGDKAVVKIVAWGEQSRKPVGEIIEILDASDTNDLAMKEILIEAGFPLNFPKEVMEELAQIDETITEEEVRKRKDVRNILTFTIDPVDAKDFDDAISIRPLKNGLYEIGVHIADVSHYVKPGTELDKEADRRATSVYLPDRVLPMLPEKISNELCSLRPHEDKFTFSAIFQMNEQGEVKQHWIGRTVIHSDHRFTYEDVQEIIEKKEGKYLDEILLLNKIAQTLRAARFAHGAINFSSQEVRFKLDETGQPIGIVIKESKEAHQLIEELMLLANRTVATYVSKIRVNKQPVPFPYRVHDTPDPEKLKVFSSFAGKFGYKFDLNTPDTIARSFNGMLQRVQGKPEQHVLETLGIRTMAKAVYTVENIGHYGLGFEDYCHFTSPIRRYPDVVVHRVVQECLSNNVHPDKQMEKVCKHSSEMERKAMEAERAGNKYKQVEYMQQYIGETFKGVISGVAHFGFWVETVDTKCEGLVSVHNLNKKEDFVFNDAEYALVGSLTGRRFRIGQEVEIRVIAANLAKRQLDYELEEELQQGQPAGRGQQPKQQFQQQRQQQQQQQQQRQQQPQGPGKKKKKKDKQRWPQGQPQPQRPAATWETPVKSDMPPIDLPEISASVVTPPEVPAILQPDVTPAVVPTPAEAAPAAAAQPAPLTGVVKTKAGKPAAQKGGKRAPLKQKPAVIAPEVAPEIPVVVAQAPVGKPAAAKKPAAKAPVAKAAAKTAAKTAVAAPPKKATAKPAAPAKKAAAKPAPKKATVAAPEKKVVVKSPAKKASVKAPAKKAAVKAPANKTAVKAPAKKTAVKAPANKTAVKAPAKKAVVKAPAKKAAVKAPAKKAAVKAPAKKAAVKAPAKKAAVKAPAKKAAVKAPAKKAAVKVSAKKAAPKKAVAKAPANKPVAQRATVQSKKARAKKAITSPAKKTVKAPAKKAAAKTIKKKK